LIEKIATKKGARNSPAILCTIQKETIKGKDKW